MLKQLNLLPNAYLFRSAVGDVLRVGVGVPRLRRDGPRRPPPLRMLHVWRRRVPPPPSPPVVVVALVLLLLLLLLLVSLLRQEVSYPRQVELQRGVPRRPQVDAVNLFAAVSEICPDEICLAFGCG